LDGERDVQKLVSCRANVREKKGKELRKALAGHYTTQGLFALDQALKSYQFYQGHTEL
jgi:transposase